MNDMNKIINNLLVVASLFLITSASAIEIKPSKFDNAGTELKYQFTSSAFKSGSYNNALFNSIDNFNDSDSPKSSKKSPGKAMLLSMLVPGLGQYYYGSRVKPFLFLGTEITAWAMHFKWQGQGDDATVAFEAFNHAHWSRDRYEQQYLLWAYGETNDEKIIATEVSHRLPKTKTQQYYEMTGKYNQFSWGWDDAQRNDSTLDMFNPGTGLTNTSLRVVSEAASAVSANRLAYEGMRHGANQKYDKARKMVMVSIINRLVSGFEAYFVTKRRNANHSKLNALSNMTISPSLKTFSQPGDTPYLKLAYSF